MFTLVSPPAGKVAVNDEEGAHMLVWLLLTWLMVSVIMAVRFCVLAERCIAAPEDGALAGAGSAAPRRMHRAPRGARRARTGRVRIARARAVSAPALPTLVTAGWH